MSTPFHKIGLVVLAAGLSRRMGRAKLLLPWDGDQPILAKTLSTALSIEFGYHLLVSGGYRAQVEEIAQGFDIPTIYNPDFATGEMLSSLKVAVQHIKHSQAVIELDGILVVLGDIPLLQASTIQSILEAFERSRDAWLVAPTVAGRQGHPVLIGASLLDDLLRLGPDQAPRDLFKANRERVLRVPVEDEGAIIDIDTPERYELYRPKNVSS